ncbi:MAG TPA: CBS domain-containing protein [Vicinamibacteria bacterium]|nr:CBS domain-containing protein [Vicinamibacteria bacterium]
MGLLKIATVPAVTVEPESSVLDAVRQMQEHNVGAAAVVEDGRLIGIFTERDVMNRVALHQKDVASTRVRAVMTRDPVTAKRDMPYGDALQMMVGQHFRHIPVLDDEGRVVGILSARDLYEHAVERLSHELNAVVSYFTADGPGGD